MKRYEVDQQRFYRNNRGVDFKLVRQHKIRYGQYLAGDNLLPAPASKSVRGIATLYGERSL